jgi:hypothetical protein
VFQQESCAATDGAIPAPRFAPLRFFTISSNSAQQNPLAVREYLSGRVRSLGSVLSRSWYSNLGLAMRVVLVFQYFAVGCGNVRALPFLVLPY